ncbi:hypothetical protein CYMTET_28799 [Cymbomonas tetramitiformis]|uniref:Uncharacterized protein n=1 Tax=Cymbomonas tetramitiformis TaxID=36881 RepID=A0AAE0KVV6_9CHLO|nr:hypothetical protein CYMTET_28799 [Cymbomonas tetramitiformis]
MILLLLLAIGAPSRSYAFSDTEIVGCGGFVEASVALAKLRKTTDPKLDYSFIKVELHTTEGLRKYQTECAPNGYYFMPVYDKGTFVIKVTGPDGWAFEPSAVTVVVDEDNQCGGGEDINFRLTGFSVKGRVSGAAGGTSCAGSEEGPLGVTMHLSSNVNPSAEAVSVTTGPGGEYTFSNLLAGKYSLTATHPKWTITGGPVEVEVNWDSVEAPSSLTINGYDMWGEVMSQGSPVLGVQVLLFSSDVKSVGCPGGVSPEAKKEGALCSAITDERGIFIFPECQCGEYTLVPRYQGEHTVFDVAPASAMVRMGHSSTRVSTVFQVTGFSIGGQVVDGAGNGIAKATVKVNGVARATTDAKGNYKLDSVTSGKYTVEAEKADMTFGTLEDFTILPNMAALPAITATAYSLCGHLTIPEARFSGKRVVALTHGPMDPARAQTDSNGKFCFMVVPGSYWIMPQVQPRERGLGLFFNPQHREVTMVSTPITGMDFTQARVTVSGKVSCLASPCGAEVMVTLTPAAAGGERLTTTLGKDATAPDTFSFTNLNPGKYTLEVHQDKWCWKESSMEVDIGTEDVTGLSFEQVGFYLQVRTSHAATVQLKLPGEPVSSQLELTAGNSRHCIDKPGMYSVEPSGCYRFEEEGYTFDTAAPRALDLRATHSQLKGTIVVDETAQESAGNVWVQMVHDGVKDDKGVMAEARPVEGKPGELEYTHWVAFGDRIRVIPQDRSKELLFYPRSRQSATVVPRSCHPPVGAFQARHGLFITGTVTPAIAAVEITVQARRGGSSESTLVMTDAEGVFKAGPFYDDAEYDLSAIKPGFRLERRSDMDTPYHFTAKRLSQISVTVAGTDSVSGVLVSLSGDDGYRKNAATGQSGQLVFPELNPGTFYVRPLLKEYSFEPPSSAVSVTEGETREVEFTGKRMAYSVFGRVASLNGVPEHHVAVEATAIVGEGGSSHFEEAVSDMEGNFRLRGLMPHSKYSIRMRQLSGVNAGLEGASPGAARLLSHSAS